MFKVNNKDTKTTPMSRYDVFIALLLTLNMFYTFFQCSIVEHAIPGWGGS